MSLNTVKTKQNTNTGSTCCTRGVWRLLAHRTCPDDAGWLQLRNTSEESGGWDRKQEFNGVCSDEEEVDINIEQETRKVAQKIEHRPPSGQDEVVDGHRAGSTTCCQTSTKAPTPHRPGIGGAPSDPSSVSQLVPTLCRRRPRKKKGE